MKSLLMAVNRLSTNPSLWAMLLLANLCHFTSCAAQIPDQAVSRQAQILFREAAEAMEQGNTKVAVEKSQEVAQLLPDDYRVQQRAAELCYLSGHPRESIPLFDKANQLDAKRAPHNWQRGIALATIGQFDKGAEQFKSHHDVNPDDVENSAWYFLCVAKSDSVEAAKKSIIPSRGDQRQPMMTILQMLRGEASPEQVLAAGAAVDTSPEAKDLAQFYAQLYVGLYYDSLGREADAIKYLELSLKHEAGGYMHDTARVYLAHRFQKSDSSDPNAKD